MRPRSVSLRRFPAPPALKICKSDMLKSAENSRRELLKKATFPLPHRPRFAVAPLSLRLDGSRIFHTFVAYLSYSIIMSKRSLFWGNASGKLGEAVFYRTGGEQRTRTYVKQIKNPKTLAQMVNRVSMKNLSSFYRATQSLLRQSFSNRPSSQSGFNAFVQASKSAQSAAISIDAAARGLSVPAGLAISRGTLAQGSAQFVGTGNLNAVAGPQSVGLVFLRIADGLGEAENAQFMSAVSAAELQQDLLDMSAAGDFTWNPDLVSDFTVGVIMSEYDDDGFVPSVRKIRFAVDSVTHAITAVDGDFTRSTYDTYVMGLYKATNGSLYLAAGIAAVEGAGNGSLYVGAFMAQRDANGAIITSNANMTFVGGDQSYTAQFLPDGEIYESVLQNLGVGESALV